VVADVADRNHISAKLLLLVVEVLIETFDLGQGCLHSLVSLVHACKIAAAFFFDVLGCRCQILAITSSTHGKLLLELLKLCVKSLL